MDWTLYVITDARLSRGRSHLKVIEAAIEGGATVVQYREKTGTTRQLVQEALALRRLTREASVPLIINDRLDVALAVEADGVHLGVEDMPIPIARHLMGPQAIIGFSPETVEQARQAEADGADYLGVGAVFGTGTKPDAGSPIGVEGLREMVRAVSIPVVAIGGITAGNAAACIQAGAAGVAVISAVVAAEDVKAAARRLRGQIEKARRG
ncbi:MAG TPA: thiamine phosphate synthase [Anaerolineae bacterium]|nr:thiamine phosphate synthase [Anaerolineae bacterium]